MSLHPHVRAPSLPLPPYPLSRCLPTLSPAASLPSLPLPPYRLSRCLPTLSPAASLPVRSIESDFTAATGFATVKAPMSTVLMQTRKHGGRMRCGTIDPEGEPVSVRITPELVRPAHCRR